MATTEAERRPLLLDGVDLRTLPLTPEDAFVLSRVDGSATEEDIALATGFDLRTVRGAIDKLVTLGALGYGPGVRSSPAPRPAHSNSGGFHLGPIIETRSNSGESHPAAALYDPSELDEEIELGPDGKRRILDTYYRLERLSHYEILGVDAKADKKAIKGAYFELVNFFHPDRYFGKNLGSFKPKLERVFARVTEAHDVLTRAQAREEYDRYLATMSRTRALDRTLADQKAHAREVERLEREILLQAELEEKAQHSYPAPAGAASLPPVAASDPTRQVFVSSAPPSLQPPADPEARRRALARKLGMSVPPGPRASPAPVDPAVATAARKLATDDLKRRYAERVAELKNRQVDHYLQAADEAERSGDVVSATNALRIATSLAPGNDNVGKRLVELESRAAVGLANGYVEQAQYEEREGRYREAAISFQRAVRGQPTPKLYERVALCLLLAKGDLREAAEFGRRAVLGAPEEAQYRVTLARVYIEAGMRQSAVGELERAQQLAPKDDSIRDWLKRARP